MVCNLWVANRLQNLLIIQPKSFFRFLFSTTEKNQIGYNKFRLWQNVGEANLTPIRFPDVIKAQILTLSLAFSL